MFVAASLALWIVNLIGDCDFSHQPASLLVLKFVIYVYRTMESHFQDDRLIQYQVLLVVPGTVLST
jgi:hypothetical protein